MPQTHILVTDSAGRYHDDKQTYCGLNRFQNSYAYTSGLIGKTNNNDHFCHFCFNGYQEDHMPEINTRANSREQLRELGTIDAESIIEAVEARVPQPHNQNRILATIAAKERRKDANQVSAQDLFYTKGTTYIGRKIEIPSLGAGGIVTDVVMPDKKIVVVVIDEKAWTLSHDTQLYVFPQEGLPPVVVNTLAAYRGRCRDERACPAFFCGYDCMKPKLHVGYCVFEREDGVICLVEDDVLVPVNEQLRCSELRVSNPDSDANAFVHTTIDTLIANRKQYKGYTINVCGIEGVFTDGKPDPTQKGWHVVVIDGRVHEIGGKTAVTIMMPKQPGPKIYAKFTIKDLYAVRSFQMNKELKNVAEEPAIGVITDIAPGRNQFVYTTVVDGKIINYAADAEVWVQL